MAEISFEVWNFEGSQSFSCPISDARKQKQLSQMT